MVSSNVLDIGELIEFVRTRRGIDFSKYRCSCLRRRVWHRMAQLSCRNLDDYIDKLREAPGEIGELLDTVTIHVTEFFRDNDVFEAITKKVFPGLVERKRMSDHNTIRVWSAGCSTGEEAYSIAILLDHLIRKETLPFGIEVFGTDVSEESCSVARAGIYSESKVKYVPPHILRPRYFQACRDGYRISDRIRRRVKFMVHDLFSKSPFTMLDLVVCRNVLIHFNHSVRDDVIGNFGASLNERGILILGKCEAVTSKGMEIFELVVPRSKIYRKRLNPIRFEEV